MAFIQDAPVTDARAVIVRGVPQSTLASADTEWVEAVCAATSLAELRELTGHESDHESYFAAKERWRDIHEGEFDEIFQSGPLPGVAVDVGDREFIVHGITHADTDAERELLHGVVDAYLDAGEGVYCEQGIWSMYFREYPDVCESDDYLWAVRLCHSTEYDSPTVDQFSEPLTNGFETIREIREQLRETSFSLIDSGSEIYGDRFARAVGDIASDLLMSHEEFGTAESYRAFELSKIASKDPTRLRDLQAYYWTAFLPQPLEREWLRRHDPELECMTHARNERIADYGVYHSSAETVHVIVGAAHLPGVCYYLNQHHTGERDVSGFEYVDE